MITAFIVNSQDTVKEFRIFVSDITGLQGQLESRLSLKVALTTNTKSTHTHTHTTILQLYEFCPGQPG